MADMGRGIDVELVAGAYARRVVGDRARVVYIESRDKCALAAIDLGNTKDSLRYGSVLCQRQGRRWVAVEEPVAWHRHGHTNAHDGIAQLGVDLLDPHASSVTLTNGVMRQPIDGRLFRVGWYLCRDDEVPFQRIGSTRIADREVAPLTEWYPASADYIMDLVLQAARDGEGDSDRLAWANDVHIDARMKAVDSVVAKWLARLDTEHDADVRAEIADGPLCDILRSRPRATLQPVMEAAQRSLRIRSALRDADVPGLENNGWQVLSDLLTSAD
jgi:hypothetical protein